MGLRMVGGKPPVWGFPAAEILAVRVGFEPAEPVRVQRFSSAWLVVPGSTTE